MAGFVLREQRRLKAARARPTDTWPLATDYAGHAWTDWRIRSSRPAPGGSLVAAVRLRADPACICLFGLYILFGTKDRAWAGVRPCTEQRGGQNLPVSRPDIWSRTRMTWGEDAHGPPRHLRRCR